MAQKQRKRTQKQLHTLSSIRAWQERIAEVLVLLVLCVQPLYLNSDRYIRLTWHKFFFFAAYMSVILVASVLVILIHFIQDQHLPKRKMSMADWAVLGFAAVTLLSAMFSPFGDITDVWQGMPERYDGAFTQLLYVAIFFIVSRWYVPRIRDFGWFGVSSIAVALLGIFQFYGMDFFKLWPNDIKQYHREDFYSIYFRSTLGNVNIVSTYVCVAVLLCGFLFIQVSSRWAPVWLAGSALNFWLMDLAGADSGRVGVLVTMVLALPFVVQNRGAIGRFCMLGASWLAVFAAHLYLYDASIRQTRTTGSVNKYVAAAGFLFLMGAAILLWGKHIPIKLSAKTVRVAGIVLMCVVIICGLIGLEVIGREIEDTYNPLYQARELLHGRWDDRFGSSRAYLWRMGVSVVPQYPLIGAGPDTYFYAFPDQEKAKEGHGDFFDKAHNEYVQILVCQGILGLLCYLLFLGWLLIKSVPRAFETPLIMAVLAGSVGYGVQAFFNISLPICSQMLWVLAGVLAGFTAKSAEQ